MKEYAYRLIAEFRDFMWKLGLLPVARFLKDLFIGRERRQIFLEFKHRYGDVIGYNLSDVSHQERRVLVNTIGWSLDGVCLGLIKALEIAGSMPVILMKREHRHLLEYYNLSGIKEIIFWDEFGEAADRIEVKEVLEDIHSIDDLLAFEYAGARVGRFAASTALRDLRMASLDLQSARDRRILAKHLSLAMTAAKQAQRIIQRVRPDLLVVSDPVYSPDGELFDNCLANGIEVITIEAAHKSNALMFKRYTIQNREEHFASISPESWRLLRNMTWTERKREQLQKEILGAYSRGDWYSVSWSTSSGKRLMEAEEIQKRLGLDPVKKTAFIFPHILWDASFSWGKSLYNSYEDWLIHAVRAACDNDKVNWVIKIHPANVGKSFLDGFHGEPAEVIALRENIGTLPPHIFLIPADSDISTCSLFTSMDYCLTVRGTVGIEAASFGVPVLTAGTGRYDQRGFTIDSDSCEGYIKKLTCIQEIPRLSPAERELAERFAYGLFVLRPFPLETVTVDNQKELSQEQGFDKIQIKITTKEGWYKAPDLDAFTRWVVGTKQADFLMPLPEIN